MFRLARLADAWGGDQKATLKLSYGNGSVTDRAGHSAAMPASHWKGILAMLERTPGGKGAARALPAGANNYADGLGSIRRNAWFVERGKDGTIVMTFARELDDSSEG
ncbi:MAG: hypothetical protein WD749_05970 [Phycisphaerales bacterium]